MTLRRATSRCRPAKVRPILLLSLAIAAVIVSTAILRRDRHDEKSAGAPATIPAATHASGFTLAAVDNLNFTILRDGEPVLKLIDGYKAQFRCNPSNDHWIGTRRCPVHLAWSPWNAADVVDVQVEKSIAKDRFELRILGKKPQLGNAAFSTLIVATRDIETGRISYGIVSDLAATPGDVSRSLGADRIEYIDPWIEGIFWPERDGHDRELYETFVFFDAATQSLTQTPKLHVFPSLPDGSYETLVSPMSTGAFAVVDANEPGIRFLVADLSGKGNLGICWWTWDPHFYLDLNDNNAQSLSFAMQIEEIPAKVGARMIADATAIPFREDPEHQLPSFARDGVNRFDDMLDAPDEWGWEQHSRACRIDRSSGFDDDVSVTIDGEPGKTTAWYTRTIGYDYFEHTPPHGGHSVTAMIRTRDAPQGARLGVLCYNGPESWLYREPDPVAFWSDPVTGTSDWQARTVKFDGTGFKRFKIVLEHSGPGQSWFDNVELKRDPSADGAGWHDDDIDWRDRDWTNPQAVPNSALRCSRPQMRNDPKRLVMAWKDCTATSPRFLLPRGDFELVVAATGEGCAGDLPELAIDWGDAPSRHEIPIDGEREIVIQVASDGESPTTFRLQFANDGLCDGKTDKNIFVQSINIRRRDTP